MRECLRLADHYSKKTVAISAMGTGGYLGYPRDVVASIMYGAVVEFDSSYSKTSLREISIVLYNKDTETVKAFEEHEHMRLYGSASLGALSTGNIQSSYLIPYSSCRVCHFIESNTSAYTYYDVSRLINYNEVLQTDKHVFFLVC